MQMQACINSYSVNKKDASTLTDLILSPSKSILFFLLRTHTAKGQQPPNLRPHLNA